MFILTLSGIKELCVADLLLFFMLVCFWLQGSGSEGRPDSPSDSLDGTKKGERKKEFVCQVGVSPQHKYSFTDFHVILKY